MWEGKLLKKMQRKVYLASKELTLVGIETNGAKLSNYCNIFLLQYCVRKYLVWRGPKKDIFETEI